jgi:ankyrin repeat protein
LNNKHDNVVKLLLDKGWPEIDVDIQGKHKKTALHLAAKEDKPGLVKRLLLRKAKQDIKDEWGCTALLVERGQLSKFCSIA